MSTIDEIREQSKTVWAVSPMTATRKEADTEDEFSALLEQMKTGAPAGSGGRDHSDTQTRTVTEVLSDGSVLITVWEGNKIVSQTKTHAENPQADPSILSTRTDVGGTQGQNDLTQQFAASATGGLSAAALALNALAQG
ncbi:hypothetical protein [uncultured Selenomonas sp.]|uniref:hypothetical protein n=1 Tax=uncultured Selenomonas sp. TaxID=159275 RepID=UPI0025CF4133|nr:hypothetical protein [uncultured Selenomonas sp.]